MFSVTRLARGAERYYFSTVAGSSDLPGGLIEADPRYVGKGAELLGLSGPVSEDWSCRARCGQGRRGLGRRGLGRRGLGRRGQGRRGLGHHPGQPAAMRPRRGVRQEGMAHEHVPRLAGGRPGLDMPARVPRIVLAWQAHRNRAADTRAAPPPSGVDQLIERLPQDRRGAGLGERGWRR